MRVPILDFYWQVRLYDCYLLSYQVMILLTFIGLPFSYFYAQAVQDDEEHAMAQQAENYMIQTYNKFQNNGLDSSETSSEEEDDTEAQDQMKPETGLKNRKKKKDKEATSAKQEQDELTPSTSKPRDQRSEMEKCMENSKKAMRKTVSNQLWLFGLININWSTVQLHDLPGDTGCTQLYCDHL